MIIKSMTPVSDFERHCIIDILEKSDNPDKSLREAFPHGYSHMTEDTIYFGLHHYDYTYAIYPRLRSKHVDNAFNTEV